MDYNDMWYLLKKLEESKKRAVITESKDKQELPKQFVRTLDEDNRIGTRETGKNKSELNKHQDEDTYLKRKDGADDSLTMDYNDMWYLMKKLEESKRGVNTETKDKAELPKQFVRTLDGANPVGTAEAGKNGSELNEHQDEGTCLKKEDGAATDDLKNVGRGAIPKSNKSTEQILKCYKQEPQTSVEENVTRNVVKDLYDKNKFKGEQKDKTFITQSREINKQLSREPFKSKALSVTRLQELCSGDISQVVFTLMDNNSGFLDLFREKQLEKKQMYCIISLLGKLCSSEDLRVETILSPACNPSFLGKLTDFIGALPAEDNSTEKQISTFFEDVLAFVKSVFVVLPMTANHRMKQVLLSSQISINYIQESKTNISRSDEICSEIKTLLDEIDSKPQIINNKKSNHSVGLEQMENIKPPDEFRSISIYPTRSDLFSNVSFLRENIVDGSYTDVEHYLDVQFRLYKEDFVGPLREGLKEYLSCSENFDESTKINNIRVHLNVRLLGSKIKGNNLECTVKCSRNNFKYIDWYISKRFMFGSLLLFSNNNFQTFFTATVFNRNVRLLKQGFLKVKFGNLEDISIDLFSDHFVMIEPEVFFEPYFQVLTVLKNLNKLSFPLEDYIIHVKQNQIVEEEPASTLTVLGGLDSTQYKAYQAAITRAFTLIQGPPGTGKTFIGLKIVESLLKLKSGPILIICYTNHALDQFLEGLLQYTEKLVRIGGQSKSSILKEYNFSDVRRRMINEMGRGSGSIYSDNRRKYYEVKRKLDKIMFEIVSIEKQIKYLTEGVLQIKYIEQYLKPLQMRIHCLSDEKLWIKWLMDDVVLSDNLDGEDNKEGDKYSKENINIRLNRNKQNTLSETEDVDSSESEVSSEGMEQYNYFIEEHKYHKNRDYPDDYPDDYSREKFDKYEHAKFCYFYRRTEIERTLNRQKFRTNLQLEIERQFVNLDCKNDLNEIHRLLTKLSDLTFEINRADPNEDYREIQNIRYHIIDELIFKKRFLDDNEIEKLENLNVEQPIESIDKDLKEIFFSANYRNFLDGKAKKSYLSKKLSSKLDFNPDVLEMLRNTTNIWLISPENRWMLYHHWKNMYKLDLMCKWSNLQKEYYLYSKQLKLISDEFDSKCLKTMEIIGLTTTTAARLRSMLEDVKPEIVIVEEAAEVFEAHVVTTLTKHCKKLVLIGDHEQLRPSPSLYKLALKYHLDISLFERMIRNNMDCNTLETQHRMRPEIVSLIVPAIYKNLNNHESVLKRPDIKGITSNVYFVTHKNYEDTVADSASRRNIHEADFLIALCTYLLNQGYSPDKITILTTYTGQMFYMKKAVEKKNCKRLRSVLITVVDNYQGEENDIILLSLVRSNVEAKVGFLATKNRICVALSRARDGFFMIGNMDNLIESSTVWQEIKEQLVQLNSIGPALPLRCAVHSHHITRVSCAADFKKVDSGGCKQPCNAPLKCGHVCPELCHVTNRDHKYNPDELHSFRCNEIVKHKYDCGHEKTLHCYLITNDNIPCGETEEVILDCGHTVVLPCKINVCDYECQYPIDTTLPCGHECTFPCSKDPETYLCVEKVPYKIQLCGHIVDKPCSTKKLDPWQCKAFCGIKLKCGHECQKLCHKYKHFSFYTKFEYECQENYNQECERKRKLCSLDHKCRKKCYENCETCDEVIVKTLRCGHTHEVSCNIEKQFCKTPCNKVLLCGHQCEQLCSERCICNVKVTNILPDCGHKFTSSCYEFTRSRTVCQEPCSKLLQCGHTCKGKCGERCELIECEEEILREAETDCDHDNVLIKCYLYRKVSSEPSPYLMMYFCNEPCKSSLPCGHVCVGTCGACMQGSLHIPCNQMCTNKLICGHTCKAFCKELCPPCNQQCLYSCQHGPCSKKCGESCHRCQMKCDWQCPHASCTKLCFEMCDRNPCNEPCPKTLTCGHSCMGFCGEVCPTECNSCNNLDYSAEDRLVVMEDCGHVVTSSRLDEMFQITEGNQEIVVKSCPVCDCVISKTKRYRNDVRQTQNLISVLKDNMVSKLRQKMKAQKYSVFRLKHHEVYGWRGNFEYYLKIFNNGNEPFQNVRVTYAVSFLTELLVQLFDDFIRDFEMKDTIPTSLYDKLIGESLKNTRGKMKLKCFILLRIQSVIKKMELRLNCMSFHDMEQFNWEVLRLRTLINHVSNFQTDKLDSVLQKYNPVLTGGVLKEMNHTSYDLNLSANSWISCPSGHFLPKSRLLPPDVTAEGGIPTLRSICPFCIDKQNESSKTNQAKNLSRRENYQF